MSGVPSTNIGKLLKDFPSSSGIYLIYNWKTKMRYVGYTQQHFGIRGRLKTHVIDLRQNRHHNKLMQKHWNENSTCWTYAVLELTNDKSREKYWIDFFDSINSGYNITYGTEHTEFEKNTLRGRSQSIESNIKRSIALTGRTKSEETKQKMRKPKNPESVAKGVATRWGIAKINKGRGNDEVNTNNYGGR